MNDDSDIDEEGYGSGNEIFEQGIIISSVKNYIQQN